MKMKRKMIIFFFTFPSSGAPVEWNWLGKTEALREKPVPVPLCPPQIPHGLALDRTRSSAVGGRRLTAWAMARPIGVVSNLTMKFPSVDNLVVMDHYDIVSLISGTFVFMELRL
jgi:hypothetical protein